MHQHRARVVQTILEKYNVEVLPRPAQSLDLNPTIHKWGEDNNMHNKCSAVINVRGGGALTYSHFCNDFNKKNVFFSGDYARSCGLQQRKYFRSLSNIHFSHREYC